MTIAAVIASAKSVAPRGEALVMTLNSLLFDAVAIPQGTPGRSITARPCLAVSRGPMTRFSAEWISVSSPRMWFDSRVASAVRSSSNPTRILSSARVFLRCRRGAAHGKAGQVGNFDAHRARHCDR